MKLFIQYQLLLFALIMIDRTVHILKRGYPRKRTISATEDVLVVLYTWVMIFWCLDLVFV
jgi:hypothetical protein